MVTPPVLLRTSSQRPPAWQRWVLNAMYNFDRYTIDDWLGLMRDHLQRTEGATAMRTARYTIDVMRHVRALTSATASLASHGDPAARSELADAALDLKSALDRLHEARDQLLKAAGAERVTDAD
ncbi:hypothetical protein ACDT10_24140 [Mycobacterium intracellulare]|uniref:Uncharacterized protein n=5 Tax=Mycobacteriaceae TaxID=1762 RepID=A0ABM7JIX7_9MYCO|nr:MULTISPECIES: hypothetical protein [Mycobacteriaceae]OBJ66799.1 hypothetical protein A5626_09375 [Mycobacterium marseillense]OCB25801.1 hypothetical protein A5689_12230 [Mycobacterium intracellulare subsp. yongonense]ORA53250.1 hypothetical protein BST19_11240 [Mycobacterium bouchedurhonense]ORA96167.1 hypothetical protein BST31_00835 [Mycobacterium marseillense]ORB76800.1 hypothetical protein BST46_28070 [Mycobacterium timonense]